MPKARRQERPPLPYYPRLYLGSIAERRFFHALTAAVGNRYHVAPKVRLADVIHCSKADWRAGHGGAISQKHLDFVLVSPGSLRILLCIELDDLSHERIDRRRRDAFVDDALRAARVPLIRIRVARAYCPSWIRAALEESLVRLPVRRPSPEGRRRRKRPPCREHTAARPNSSRIGRTD